MIASQSTKENYSRSESPINGKRLASSYRGARSETELWGSRSLQPYRGHEGSQRNDRSQKGSPTGATAFLFDYLFVGGYPHLHLSMRQLTLLSFLLGSRIEVHPMLVSLKNYLSSGGNSITRISCRVRTVSSSSTRRRLSGAPQQSALPWTQYFRDYERGENPAQAKLGIIAGNSLAIVDTLKASRFRLPRVRSRMVL
jgi:hypothetical protein